MSTGESDMSKLITVEHSGGGWAAIPNRLLEDPSLPWKAKGLWAYLYSRPSGWQVREADLVNRSADGRDSVRSSLAALEQSGWLLREQTREGGRFVGTTYTLLTPSTGKPSPGNPSTEKPSPENPPLSNTEGSNTEETTPTPEGGRDEGSAIVDGLHFVGVYPDQPHIRNDRAVVGAYLNARKRGAEGRQLLDALNNYRHWLKENDKLGTRYVMSPISFLSKGWQEWIERTPEPETKTGADGLRYLR